MSPRARPSPMAFFRSMGDRIEREWCARNYDERLFPALAERHLLETPVHEHTTPWALVQQAARDVVLPQISNFGQPPLVVYRAPRFYIEVLFWLESTTAIHQHSFAGAFAVFQGSSVHSRYRFEPERHVSPYLALGALSYERSELLARGMTQQIHPGPDFIHALFHLEHPSVSVVVRTYGSPEGQPQFNYLKPGLAIDPFLTIGSTTKELELLELLLKLERADARDFAFALLDHRDVHTVYRALNTIWKFQTPVTTRLYHAVVKRARRRHGEIIDHFTAAIDELNTRARIVSTRERVMDPELRFFLALLLNVPTAEQIHRLVRERYPKKGAVADTLAAWIRALARHNALDYEAVDELQLDLLDDLVHGLSFEAITAGLRKEYGTRQVARKLKDLRGLCRDLQRMPTLAPLFT